MYDDHHHDEIHAKPAAAARFHLKRSGTVTRAIAVSSVSESDFDAEKHTKVSEIFPGPKAADAVLALLSEANFSLARHALEKWPADKLAVRTHGHNMSGPLQEISFGEMRRAAYFAANLLYSFGIRKVHKVLLLQGNSFQCVAAYWGTHYLGAVAVMATPTHVERKYLIKYTDCRAIVAPRSILGKLTECEVDDRTNVNVVLMTDGEFGEGAKPGNFQRVPCTNDENFLDGSFDETGRQEYKVVEFDGTGRADKLDDGAKKEFDSIQRLDECLWYFTSGTTGKPKGCVHSQIDLAFAAETYGKACMGLGEGSNVATDVAMAGPYAMGSNLIFPFIAGSSIYLDHTDKLNSDDYPNEDFPIIRKSQCQVLVTIPGTLANIAKALAAKDSPSHASLVEALKPCRAMTSAGAPLPPPTYCNMVYVSKQCGLNIAVLDGIGTSELQHIFASNFAGKVRSDEGSIGSVVDGYEMRLLNAEPSGADSKGWKGEVMVRTVMKDIQVTYSNKRPPKGVDYGKATEEANWKADDEGAPWYITGDVAQAEKKDGEWYLYLLGRTTDLASQINDGTQRGMGIEDFKRKAVANQIMFSVGLLEIMSDICTALLQDKSATPNIFADNVYPVVVSLASKEEQCVFVVSVTPTFWPEGATVSEEEMAKWTKYIKEKSAGGSDDDIPIRMFFSRYSDIPRTPAPLLKPIVGRMKKALQGWVDAEKPPNMDEAACTRASLSLRLVS